MISQTHQSLTSFIEYKQVILTLVSDLRKLREFSQELNLTESVKLISEVLHRIETDTFSVAIVGEFKRGKSTFINALLGQDILPANVLPCSATLNRVTYGVKPFAQVVYKDGHQEKISIDKLAEYVTKLTSFSEEIAKNIKEAVVYYPVSYCQNNVEIIDTPGLNDDEVMTDVTLSVIPKVDAAIMVISTLAPFSQYERDFLEKRLLTSDLGRVIFIVNIWEHLTPEEGDILVNEIKKRITNYVLIRARDQFGENSEEYKICLKKIGEPKIFGLYVTKALQAKIEGDQELLTLSRFPEFEIALEKFLTQEQGAIRLQVPANRVLSSSKEIFSAVNIRKNALQMKQEDFKAAYEKSVTEIGEIRYRQKKELKLIDEAATNVKAAVRPFLHSLPRDLKEAAIDAIDSTKIEIKELENQRLVKTKLGTEVSNSLRQVSNKLVGKIQEELQKGIIQEIERLKDFANSVDRSLTAIEMQFVDNIAVTTEKRTTATAEAITAGISVMTGLWGIWSGYRVAGVKGAAVGALGSLGTVMSGSFILGVLGISATFPMVIALSIASIFTGKSLAQWFCQNDQLQNFKANYQERVLEEIDRQMREQRLDQKIDEKITDAFESLKNTVRQEVELLLDNTEKTLNELSDRRGRDETLTDAELQRLQYISTETEGILGNVQRLSDQLVKIMSV